MHAGCLIRLQAAIRMKQVGDSGREPKSDRNPHEKICNIKLIPAGTGINNDPVHKLEITDRRGPEENTWTQDATCFKCRHLLYERPPKISPRSQHYHDISEAARP